MNVNVISPTGELENIPPEQLQDAVGKFGYRSATPQELQQNIQQEQYGTGLGNELRTGAESAAATLTGGLSRNPENLLNFSALGLAKLAGLGDASKAITEATGETPQEQQLRKQYNPASATTGAILSVPAAILAAPETSLPGLINTGAGKLAGMATSALGEGLLPKAAATILNTAIQGAAYGNQTNVEELSLGDPTLNASKVLSNIGSGAWWGALTGAGFAGLGMAASKLFGTSPQAQAIFNETKPINPGEPPPPGGTSPSIMEEARKYPSADEFINGQAIKEKLSAQGVPVNPDNTVTLYHATSPENMAKIQESGFIKGGSTATGGMTGLDLKPSAFFGTDKEWTADAWGSQGANGLIEVKVPVGDIRQPAQNLKEVYFEGGLKRGDDGIWRPTEPPRSTFYDKMARRDVDEKKLTDIYNQANQEIKPTSQQADIAKTLSTEDVNIRPQDVAYYQERARVKVPDPLTGQPVNAMEAAPPLIREANTPPTQQTLQDLFIDSRSEIQDQISDLHDQADELLDQADFEIPTNKLKNMFDENINRLENVKVKGNTTIKTIKSLERFRDQLAPVLDSEGNVLKEAPQDFTAQEAKELIGQLDNDLESIYEGKMQRGKMNQAERELFGVRTSIRNGLSDYMDKAGFPEYKNLLAEQSRKLKIMDAYDKNFSANNAYAQRMLGSLQREVEGIQTTAKMTPKGKAAQADWLKTIKDLGNETGKDFSTMYKDRYIWAKFHPDEASFVEKGSPFSQVLKGIKTLGGAIKSPESIPGRIFETVGGAPDLLESMKRRGAMEDLMRGTSTNPKAVNSILGNIGKLGKSGSSLANSVFGGVAIPTSVRAAQYLNNEPSINEADQKLNTLMNIEKAAKKTDSQIDTNVKSIFSNKPVSMNTEEDAFHDKDPEELAQAVQELRAQTNELVNDPEKLTNNLTAASQGIKGAPNILSAMNMTAVRGLNLLQQKINQVMPEPDQAPLDHKPVPSQAQLYSLTKTMRYINKPQEVLKEVATGRLSTEGLEALTTVHPELYDDMKAKLMNALATAQAKGENIPNSKRLAMSAFLGQPLDSTMKQEAIANNQLAFAAPVQNQAQQTGLMPGARSSQAKHLTLSTRLQTPMQQVVNRQQT